MNKSENLQCNSDTTSSRKAQKSSTPKKTSNNVALNISNISAINVQPSVRQSLVGPFVKNKTNSAVSNGNLSTVFQKPSSSKFNSKKNQLKKQNLKPLTDEEKLLSGYNIRLQGLLLDKITRASNLKSINAVNDSLANLQERISHNQKILRETKENIQKINENIDIQHLLNLNNADFKKMSDTVNQKKHAKTMNKRNDDVAEELQKLRNKIKCENIKVPESVSALETFTQILKGTASAYEKLAVEPNHLLDENKAMSDLLEDYQNQQIKVDKLEERVSCVIPSIESELLEDASNKICGIDKMFSDL